MKIGVVTTTRAEYGLLKPIIKKIENDPETDLVLIVTGTHLLDEFGHTIDFIYEDGFSSILEVPVKIDTGNSESISCTMGNYFQSFSRIFQKLELDFVIVLGDRYELIPICFCATNAHTPIAHISGGEITEGAIDDAVRHCVTKLSYLHFPACEEYRNRIIQLGESPERVFNVGDPGVENVKKMQFPDEDLLREKLGIDKNIPYFSVIFHPITLDEASPVDQVKELLSAIEDINDVQFVIMKSNADAGGNAINEILEAFVLEHQNCKLFSSLRIEEFLALQKYSLGLIGNSSSGIVETPCFGIPTINIGDRQKGRLMADSIICCPVDRGEIKSAIELAISDDFCIKARKTMNPYGSGETSAEILKHIKECIKSRGIDLKKRFYDIKGQD